MLALDTFLEIVKITVPAFVVFITIYVLIKQWTQSQITMQQLSNQQIAKKETVRIRLQAYERLALFCERISIPSLLMRLRMNNMNNEDLKNAMYIAIQKEYEHNMVQQIYVSDQLWKIITVAKENILKMIDVEYNQKYPDENAQSLAAALMGSYTNTSNPPMSQALEAIKKESSLLF